MNIFQILVKAAAILTVSFFVLALAFATFLFWWVDPLQMKTPSDEELVALFQHHRAEFEKLEQMTAEDFRHGIYFCNSDEEDLKAFKRMKRPRRQEYKKLLSAIDPALQLDVNSLYPYEGLKVKFTVASGGMGPLGDDWLKGIEYLSKLHKDEGKVMDSLNEGFNLPCDDYLRSVEPNWFLFYSKY